MKTFFISLAAMTVPHVAFAAICATGPESDAIKTRMLQTELIVAALSCGEKSRYGQFVQRFEPVLIEKAGHLKSYFSRNYGNSAPTELNMFITSLANHASQRSLRDPAYCQQVSSLFSEVLSIEPANLTSFASGRATAGVNHTQECSIGGLADRRQHTP